MDPNAQVMLSVGSPTLAVLFGILINNSRLTDVNNPLGDVHNRIGDVHARLNEFRADMNKRFDHVDQRFDDAKEMWHSELHRFEEVLDARLKHLEER